MEQTLLLEPSGLRLVLILLAFHVQLRLALDAHAELLLAQGVAVRQPLYLVAVGQHLLAELQCLLLHLDFLLAVGHELLVQRVLLRLHLLYQFGVGQQQDGVALLHPRTLLHDDALHVAAHAAVHLQGQHGLHHALLLHILQEVGLRHFGDAQRPARHPLPGGRALQHQRVNGQRGKQHASNHVILVAHEPRFLL